MEKKNDAQDTLTGKELSVFKAKVGRARWYDTCCEIPLRQSSSDYLLVQDVYGRKHHPFGTWQE